MIDFTLADILDIAAEHEHEKTLKATGILCPICDGRGVVKIENGSARPLRDREKADDGCPACAEAKA